MQTQTFILQKKLTLIFKANLKIMLSSAAFVSLGRMQHLFHVLAELHREVMKF